MRANKTVALAALAVALVLVGCLSRVADVGTLTCAEMQEGCEFQDHVLTVAPSGTVCPTWNVQTAHYDPTGQPDDTYGVEDYEVAKVLLNASQNDKPAKMWYRGVGIVHLKCESDHKFIIYRAELVG